MMVRLRTQERISNMMTIREKLRKGQRLREHLKYNFYPPISEEVAESIIQQFTKYWNGAITFNQLCEEAPISREELIARFDFFISEEDLNQR